MKRLIRAALAKLGIRAPSGGHMHQRDHGDDIPVMLSPGGLVRCDQARVSPPRIGDPYVYIEQCRLRASHSGDHLPGPREAVTERAR